jgi:nitronate monooxygenase
LTRAKRLQQLLGINYPLVQAAMLGVSTPEMAASISARGGLGSVAAGGLSAGQTHELLVNTRRLTGKPFAVNLFADQGPAAVSGPAFLAMQQFLKKFCQHRCIPYPDCITAAVPVSYHEQLETVIRQKIAVLSFTFGLLDQQSISGLKSHGIRLIGTASCLKEAQLLAQSGVDVVIAQGIEAGGHRASFLKGELPLIATHSLVTQIVDSLSTPVLAAGGIADHCSFKAAMSLSASGVVAGSAFLTAHESAASSLYKNKVQAMSRHDTVLTKAFSGKWARAIKNEFITELEKSGLATAGFAGQLALTCPIRQFAAEHQMAHLLPLWAGQSAYLAKTAGAAEIMMSILGAR